MLIAPSTDTNQNCDDRDHQIEGDVEEEGEEGGEGEEEGEAEGVDQEVAQQEGQPDQESYGSATPALVVTDNRVDKYYGNMQLWLMATCITGAWQQSG